jgi:hypothetical protein
MAESHLINDYNTPYPCLSHPDEDVGSIQSGPERHDPEVEAADDIYSPNITPSPWADVRRMALARMGPVVALAGPDNVRHSSQSQRS